MNDITNGYQFQQLVAEIFRSHSGEDQPYRISVHHNGVGPDGGVDILVELQYEDLIHRHSKRWVVECKCWNEKNSLQLQDISVDNINSLLTVKEADGYLLVCKGTAAQSLKQRFKELNDSQKNPYLYEVWEGTRVWHEIVKRESLIKAFFPNYYQEWFIQNLSKQHFEDLVKRYHEEVKKLIAS